MEFEIRGFDIVAIGVYPVSWQNYETKEWYSSESSDVAHIEVKPTVGDDYPAVLQKIRSAVERSIAQSRVQRATESPIETPVLFLEEYTGVGATMEQFIAIFENSAVKVIFLDEVT